MGLRVRVPNQFRIFSLSGTAYLLRMSGIPDTQVSESGNFSEVRDPVSQCLGSETFLGYNQIIK